MSLWKSERLVKNKSWALSKEVPVQSSSVHTTRLCFYLKISIFPCHAGSAASDIARYRLLTPTRQQGGTQLA